MGSDDKAVLTFAAMIPGTLVLLVALMVVAVIFAK
jgi:hypothetical protein